MFHFLKRSVEDMETLADEEYHVDVDDQDTPCEDDVGQIALDVLETQEGYVIIAPLAGVPRSDVDVNISRNILTITGNRPQPEIYSEAIRVPIQECFYGPFSRSIILPENLALDMIRATIERGMLIVTIPYLIISTRSVKVEHLEWEE